MNSLNTQQGPLMVYSDPAVCFPYMQPHKTKKVRRETVSLKINLAFDATGFTWRRRPTMFHSQWVMGDVNWVHEGKIRKLTYFRHERVIWEWLQPPASFKWLRIRRQCVKDGPIRNRPYMMHSKTGFTTPSLLTHIIITKMSPRMILRRFQRTDVECAS